METGKCDVYSNSASQNVRKELLSERDGNKTVDVSLESMKKLCQEGTSL